MICCLLHCATAEFQPSSQAGRYGGRRQAGQGQGGVAVRIVVRSLDTFRL
jgi:hypothetical protein